MDKTVDHITRLTGVYSPRYRGQRQEPACPERLAALQGEDGGEGEEGEERLRVGRGEEDGGGVHAEQQCRLFQTGWMLIMYDREVA